MIIQHQKNIAAFVGAHVIYSFFFIRQRISATSEAAPPSGPVAGSLALTGVGI